MGKMEDMRGQVRRSINNYYNVVTSEGALYACRIKGKTLKIEEYEYNPIAVGDWVEFTPYSETEGLVTKREERHSAFRRWNIKLEKNQTMAANMDQVAIITSADYPPFRPRFVDRAIACVNGAEILIVMNKSDFLLTEDEAERWGLYHKLGYNLVAVSALSGDGLDKLLDYLKGKTTAFIGQSGVGKSTLVNAILSPSVKQRTGELSEKYQRGRHTTNHALYLEKDDVAIIDTPGVRELMVPYDDARYLLSAFPEFENSDCLMPDCLHLDEPGCQVKWMVEHDKINLDRYESYVRMQASLSERSPSWARCRFRKNKQ